VDQLAERAAAYGAAIVEAAGKSLERELPKSRSSNWVTALLDPCDRRPYLWRIAGEKARPLDPESLARMREGNDQEERLRQTALPALGFEVFRDRPHKRSRWAELNISGRTDLWVRPLGSTEDPILCEFKAPASPWSWDSTETIDSMLENRWQRKWVAQLAMYEWIEEQAAGLLVIKQPGAFAFRAHVVAWEDPRVFPLVDRQTAVAKLVEGALESADLHEEPRANAMPPQLRGDPAECRRCAFFETACYPELEWSGPTLALDLASDESFMGTLAEEKALEEPHRRYEAAKRRRQARLGPIMEKLVADGNGKATLLLPGYVVESKTVERKAYAVAAASYLRTDIEALPA